MFVCQIRTTYSLTEFRKTPAVSQYSVGSVSGHVLTVEGTPIAYAKVYAKKKGEAFQVGAVPITEADARGAFTMSRLSPGEYAIVAFEEEAGYPDLTFSFYSRANSTFKRTHVNIMSGRVVQADVRVAAKGAHLFISVIDTNNKKPVSNAEITLSYVRDPKIYLRFGAADLVGHFKLLVPSFIDINMDVSAPGYSSWHFRGTSRSRYIQLKPGSEYQVIVDLSRTK